jgi:magnesium chelatase subunit D
MSTGSAASSRKSEALDDAERAATILACFALDPSLAGLVFFDLDPALIYPLAGWLQELLAGEPPLIQLGPRMAEDTLWERFTLNLAGAQGPGYPRLEPGRLVGYDRLPGIVVVPDLAELGLPAARAAVTLIGADVAHLERLGVARPWRPADRWLAALRRDDVNHVSAHLLDRFALRIDAAELELPWNPSPALSEAVEARLGEPLPALSDAAVDQVVATVAPDNPGARRELALGRLARALAALEGAETVLPGHVTSAAELAGLRPGRTRRASAGPRDRRDGLAHREHAPEDGRAAPGPVRPGGVTGRLPVETGGNPMELTLDPADVTPTSPEPAGARRSRGAYPEDAVQPGRRFAPLLRTGWQRVLTGPPRGQPTGTQRALSKRDIAVAATLLNAARFQRRRCPQHYGQGHGLHMSKRDLLSYRRVPLPGYLLVLLLDHTCRAEDWDWLEPLSEYLGWAYVNRALVGVVEVGAPIEDADGAEPGRELRATQFRSRGVLDRRVAEALERHRRGRATPLAHGLTLAADMLRRSTQQGGPAVSEAVLVVVTDGRANVPLADSLAGTVPADVADRGVRSALAVARDIRDLGHGLGGTPRRVRSVVIDPGWQLNGYFASMLAAALAAPLEHGTPAEPRRAESGWVPSGSAELADGAA